MESSTVSSGPFAVRVCHVRFDIWKIRAKFDRGWGVRNYQWCSYWKSGKVGQIVFVKETNVFEYSLRSDHIKDLLCWGVERYWSGCKNLERDFQYVETAILAKHTPKNKHTFGNGLKKNYQKSTNLTNKKQGQDSSGHEEKIWFCAAYQRNKWAHKSTHILIVKGRMRMPQHICASCWQKD